jgi:hypothetical protein
MSSRASGRYHRVSGKVEQRSCGLRFEGVRVVKGYTHFTMYRYHGRLRKIWRINQPRTRNLCGGAIYGPMGHKSLKFLRGPKATCTTYDWRSFTSHIGIHPIELLPTERRSPLTRALADESASTCGPGLCLHTLITTKKNPQDLILLCRSLSLGDTRPSAQQSVCCAVSRVSSLKVHTRKP